ncbi:MAG: hypothetical protein AAFZ15_14545 [Bacteroidota bacterium]
MKKVIFFSLFVFVLTFSFANETDCGVSCNAPANVVQVAQSAGCISFDWDDCSDSCTEFAVWYVRQADGYKSSEARVSTSAISFSGLTDGTYDFYFRTVCGGGMSSVIGVEDVVLN